ncbi:hypothetical protein AAZX31_09G066100 [Glycine max]
MNLYFKRLDGQVVICEDFFVAMRDANDAYYVTFLLLFVFFPSNSLHFFYSFCINLSTTMQVFSSWDNLSNQEIPPTPGQLVKEPTFIHVVVGLLDSTSKDIPLSIVYDSMRLCNLLEVMINQSALQSLE